MLGESISLLQPLRDSIGFDRVNHVPSGFCELLVKGEVVQHEPVVMYRTDLPELEGISARLLKTTHYTTFLHVMMHTPQYLQTSGISHKLVN